jgi:uncharacterized protein
MSTAEPALRIEVVYLDASGQFLVQREVAAGTTVSEALDASGVDGACRIAWRTLAIGVWSKPVQPGTVLGDGDRIEIYRPLQVDPKDARRRRVEKARRAQP